MVYVYNEVPLPGNQNAPFNYTLSLRATYTYRPSSTTYNSSLSEDYSFQLKHGEYAVIESSESIAQGYLRADITLYNADGSLKQSKQTIIAQAPSGRYGSTGTFNNTQRITVTQSAESYYSTSVSRTAQTQTNFIYLGNSSDTTTMPYTLENTREAHWNSVQAGGTIVFTNIRDTYNITIKKVLHAATSGSQIFMFNYSYILDGDTSHVTTGSLNVSSGDEGRILSDMPAGAELTVSEVNDGNYTTTVVASSGTSDMNTEDDSAFTFVVASNDTLTFTNTMKSYSVTFIKVDQDMQPNVNATFSLLGPSGSLGSDLYAQSSATGGNGQFFASDRFWVGDYVLTERIAPVGYEGLSEPANIKVTTEGIECDNIHIKIVNPETDSYIIYVINEKIITMTVRKRLQDPFLASGTRQFTFRIDYNYELSGASISRTQNIVLASNNDVIGSTTFKVPANSRVKVTEVLSEADQLSYETNYTVTNGSDTVIAQTDGIACDFGRNVTAADDGDVITFFNLKQTTEVTIFKDVTAANKSGTFGFIATLVGNTPIANYTVGYSIPSGSTAQITTEHTSTTAKTDEFGKMQFTLKDKDSLILEVPIGLRINLQEVSMVGNSNPTYTLEGSYAVLMNADYTETGEPYTGRTTWNEDTRMFSVVTLPNEYLTITVFNMSGPKDIYLKKTDTYGAPLPGAVFEFYKDVQCTNPATITVNGNKVNSVTSEASFTRTNGIDHNLTFRVIPGVYYFMETNTLTGYKENEYIYRLTVGDAGMLVNGIQLPEGQEYMLDRMYSQTVVEPGLHLTEYGILNIPTQTQKVILRKTNSVFTGLPNARLVITAIDGTQIDEVISRERGIAYIGEWPLGNYFVHEIIVPAGYDNNDGRGW